MNRPLGSLGGILDFEGITRRCKVVDATDPDSCLQWKGAVDCRGMPKLWFPPFAATVTLSSVMGFLKTGRRPILGEAWYPRCDLRTCGNPEHWRKGTLSQATLRHPRKNQALHTAKVTANRRARATLNPELVAEIRAGGGTLAQWSERCSVSKSTIARARRGETWGALATSGSSVFEWRP